MSEIKAPYQDFLHHLENKDYIGDSINFDVLNKLGIFILKAAIRKDVVNDYYKTYLAEIESGGIRQSEYHLTEVKFGEDSALFKIIRDVNFLSIVNSFFDGHVGSDFIRVVKKDSTNFAPVFLHQDTGYQIGGFERYSSFIALTHCNQENGGLILYPGTHNFGYLGDVGEIREILPFDYPRIESVLAPGDILFMHSSIWHKSPENLSRKDRVYLEVHLQSIDEPSTRIELCGVRKSGWVLTMVEDEIFNNSRTQRLRKLYKEIKLADSSSQRD